VTEYRKSSFLDRILRSARDADARFGHGLFSFGHGFREFWERLSLQSDRLKVSGFKKVLVNGLSGGLTVMALF
jgi:hypothetical protein